MRNKKGYYINKYNIIEVQGTVNGIFYRKSTRKKATKDNLTYIKKHHYDVLLKLCNALVIHKTSLESFGTMVLQNTAHKRSVGQQKDVIGKFNNHILPTFKNFALSDVKVSDVENWQMKLIEKLSSGSVKKCREILNLIFRKAFADDKIDKNYVQLADNVQVTHKKKEPYNTLELTQMLENSTGWFHMYLLLSISTGLRVGEVTALQWKDIDLAEGFIYLKRSISNSLIVDETSRTNRTKNHHRTIPLDTRALEALKSYSEKKPDNEWLFVNTRGSNYKDGKSINKCYWKPLLKTLGIKDKCMSALRHSFISIMKNNGTSDSWIKSVIGHSQSSKVMDDFYFTFNHEKNQLSNSNDFFKYLELDG